MRKVIIGLIMIICIPRIGFCRGPRMYVSYSKYCTSVYIAYGTSILLLNDDHSFKLVNRTSLYANRKDVFSIKILTGIYSEIDDTLHLTPAVSDSVEKKSMRFIILSNSVRGLAKPILTFHGYKPTKGHLLHRTRSKRIEAMLNEKENE